MAHHAALEAAGALQAEAAARGWPASDTGAVLSIGQGCAHDRAAEPPAPQPPPPPVELAEGPYFALALWLDARALFALGAACRLLRQLDRTRLGPSPAWGAKGQDSLKGLLRDETNQRELRKWAEVVDMGIVEHMRLYPERFRSRTRCGIPQRHRWRVWKVKVGVEADDPLIQEYGSLYGATSPCTEQIKRDISCTFPEIFSSEHQCALLRVLNAYAAHTPSVGYCRGMNFVAGLLLLVSGMQEEESFAVLCHLMDSPAYDLAGFYRSGTRRRYLMACDALLAIFIPEVRRHFDKQSVEQVVYVHQWYLTLFINCFPLSMVAIIWDGIICEGLPVILRIAISILQVLKKSLLNMRSRDIIRFFNRMRTYDDEGSLNSRKIGQLLMLHTEQVFIPQNVKDFLAGAEDADLWAMGAVPPLGDVDDDELDPNSSTWSSSSGWLHTIVSLFSFGSRRTSSG